MDGMLKDFLEENVHQVGSSAGNFFSAPTPPMPEFEAVLLLLPERLEFLDRDLFFGTEQRGEMLGCITQPHGAVLAR